MPITRGNWDLHKSGSKDASRHREKLKDAFRKNLRELISEESIITQDQNKKVRVPIKALDSYRFIHDPYKQKHIAQGDGETEVGDIVGREQRGPQSGKPGDKEGEEYYEAEIELEELVSMMMEDLRLPKLDPKKKADLTVSDVVYDDIRKKGMLSNLDKKRSILNNIKRNAARGSAKVGEFDQDDLRFRTWSERERPVTSAVVVAMMDVSGSMTTDKKYIARSIFFWMVQFLRRKYENVEIVFISHTTTAKVCTEKEFFYQGESGGTLVSSAYKLALETIERQYDPSIWNIFAFHFSDGETWNDEDQCIKYMRELIKVCNMVGYGEIDLTGNQHIYRMSQAWTTLLTVFATIKSDNFIKAIIADKTDVWKTLRRFFSEELIADAE